MGELTRRYIEKQRDLTEIGIAPHFPRIIKIDICNACNYACVFCPQAKQEGKIGNIDDILCKRIMKDAYKEGAREICFSSTGEPLLNPRLPDYILLAKGIGYEYTFFNTNGFLMDEALAKKIIESGADSVKFSINAAAKNYKLVHGGGSYERVIENLKIFDRVRKEKRSSCHLYVSYVATKYTIDEAEIVKRDTKEYSDEFMFMKANNRGGAADEVDKDLYAGTDEYTYIFPCSQIFNNVYVTSEGYMVACCQDFDNQMVLEDLHEISVGEAWNGKHFMEFRSRFLKRDYNGLMCENCLFNRHNKVKPLRPEYAGYSISEKKRENLMKRIKRFSENVKV